MEQESNSKMNILVLGSAGVGKSTLIRAIAGMHQVQPPTSGIARKFSIYESDVWPLRIIDARGFDYQRAKKRRLAKKQIRSFSKEQMKLRKRFISHSDAGGDGRMYANAGSGDSADPGLRPGANESSAGRGDAYADADVSADELLFCASDSSAGRDDAYAGADVSADESLSDGNIPVDSGLHTGVDVVWCCLDGRFPRTYEKDVAFMSRLIRRWRDVPVFAVITRSCFRQDFDENIQTAAQAFAKAKKVNLQRIIPVLARETFLDDTTSAPPMGIDELCEATLDCADTARSISADNRRQMELDQRKFTANAIIGTAAATAAAVGAVPFSFADSAILVPLETLMTRRVLKTYKVDFSGELVSTIVGSTAITNLAKAVITPLKALPIAGSVINGVVAGTIVLALGEAEVAVCEAIYTGRLDPSRMDDVIRTIEEKTADSPVIGTVVKFLQENASSLTGKSAKEIISILQKVLTRKLLK